MSGLYWVNTTSGLHQLTCDMELEYGGHKGGWTKIVKFDTSKGDSCPTGCTNMTAHEKVMCRAGNAAGCYSQIFGTYNMTFNKICGQAKGYQKGVTSAFLTRSSIDTSYVDGVSITLGNPRKHVWTYVVGVSVNANYPNNNCPCAIYPGPNPPSFVSDHYYCQSGQGGGTGPSSLYVYNVLWDGTYCESGSNCCTNLNMPRFFRQPALPMSDYLEAKICHRSPFATGGTFVESIELYIQ